MILRIDISKKKVILWTKEYFCLPSNEFNFRKAYKGNAIFIRRLSMKMILFLFVIVFFGCETFDQNLKQQKDSSHGQEYPTGDQPTKNDIVSSKTIQQRLLEALDKKDYIAITNIVQNQATNYLSKIKASGQFLINLMDNFSLLQYCITNGMSVQIDAITNLIRPHLVALGYKLSSDQVLSLHYLFKTDWSVPGAPRILIYRSAASEPDSAGGVGFSIEFINLATKPIKYIIFTVIPYNRVGDIANCAIKGNAITFRGQITGPILPGESNSKGHYWEAAWYNNTISKIKIFSIEIQYMDNSKIKLKPKDFESYIIQGGD